MPIGVYGSEIEVRIVWPKPYSCTGFAIYNYYFLPYHFFLFLILFFFHCKLLLFPEHNNNTTTTTINQAIFHHTHTIDHVCFSYFCLSML